jgi:uncharacterized membrane protein YbaN (DUF454 family)
LVQRHVRRAFVLFIGWALIVFGVIGLFVPVLQGVLFILVGLYVLSRESRAAHAILEKARARFPGVDAKLRGWRRKLSFLDRRKQ